MPTSYTAPLYDGKEITFEEFVLRSARGMGATILLLLRDASLDVVPTEENVIEDSTYNIDRFTAAEARLVELGEMSAEQAGEAAESDYHELFKAFRIAQGDYVGLKHRYKRMIERVEAWEPPTENHAGLKTFMLNQLDESLRCDCYEPTPPVVLSASGWLRREIEKAERNVSYHREQVVEQDKRNSERRAWIRELHASLASTTSGSAATEKTDE